MDLLQISALSVMTKIGVHAWEQKILQQLSIDLSIGTDFRECQDKLENTLDYDKLCQTITEFVSSNSFALIETVAEEIARLIKTNFKVEELSVTVHKPQAIKNAKSVSVTIKR